MIKKLSNSLSLIMRVLKNAVLRPYRVVSSRIKYIFSVGRVTSAVPGMVKKLPKLARRRPEKREDYFDWGVMYVAKSLVLLVSAIVVIAVLLFIFVLHPLFTSWWWVKDMYYEDTAVSSYSGRVRLFYDKEFTSLKFEGRLNDGSATEYGEEYWENGRPKYAGSYEKGGYSGSGILYLEDGSILYRGEFSKGEYSGSGELYQDGMIWKGEFVKGELQGSGTILKNDVVLYTGNFTDGIADGTGKENYSDGKLHYSGSFSGGVPDGKALEYYPDGTLKYNGQFTSGKYNGEGTLYSEDGEKLYSGSFEMGEYSGSGTLYSGGSRVYTGEFENGEYSGSGTLYGADGTVTSGTFSGGSISGAAARTYPNGMKYEGCFENDQPSGVGSLSDASGKTIYSETFLDGDIDYTALIGLDTATAAEYFPGAVRTVADDCFRFTDRSGIILECSFAGDSSPATVRAVYALPVGAAVQTVSSAEDVNAPSALSVTEADGVLPEQAKLLGVTGQSAACYAAAYQDTVVYWWVGSDGALLMKSARSASGETKPSDSTEAPEQDRSELEKLFEDIGLDISDFESLGF